MDASLLLVWALFGAFILGLCTLVVLTTPRSKGGRPPLELELLGVRITPAVLTWTGLGTTANVSDAGNWNGGPINSGDTFTFDGSLGAASNKSAIWDAAAPNGANGINVSGAYTGTVTVAVNLAPMTLNQTAAAGSVAVDAGDLLDVFNYTLNASTLNGPGSVSAFNLTVAGGAIVSGANKVTVGNNLQVNGTVTLNNAATLLNAGSSSAWSGGQINVQNNSSITNTGSWQVLCDQSIVGAPGTSFFNGGSFTKNTTNGKTSLLISFSNTATHGGPGNPSVTDASGTLEFTTSATQIGQFTANGPGVLLFDSGTQTFTTSCTFSGNGNVKLNNIGQFIAQAGVTVSINGPSFELGGTASLSGPADQTKGAATYSISGPTFTWDGGVMELAQVNVYSTLNITGAPLALTLNYAHLATYAQTTWDATCDIGMIGSTIDNVGTFQVKNAQKIFDQGVRGIDPPSVFSNDDNGHGARGTVTKLAGAPSTFNIVFNNWGTLAFNGFGMAFANLTQSGANSVTNLGGGTLIATSPFTMNSGVLIAPGTINGSIQMGGALQFSGATSALTVTGDFTETANSSVQLRIGGNLVGQYDQVNVGGTASLNGQLHLMLINGYTPKATDRFKVLTAGTARNGTWTVDPGWTPFYNPNDVTLSNP